MRWVQPWQVVNGGSMASGGDRWVAGAHHNLASRVVAEGDAGAIHLADDGGFSGNFFYRGGFTKTELTHALAERALSFEFNDHTHGSSV